VFFDWYGGEAAAERALRGPWASEYRRSGFRALRAAIEAHDIHPRAIPEAPYFERDAPVTLLSEDVEPVWQAVAERDDWTPLREKLAEIASLRAIGPAGDAGAGHLLS